MIATLQAAANIVTWRVTRVDTRLNGPCVTTTHLVDAPLPFVALRAVAGHHGDTQGPAYLLTGVRGSPGPPWRWTLRRFGKLIRYTVQPEAAAEGGNDG